MGYLLRRGWSSANCAQPPCCLRLVSMDLQWEVGLGLSLCSTVQSLWRLCNPPHLKRASPLFLPSGQEGLHRNIPRWFLLSQNLSFTAPISVDEGITRWQATQEVSLDLVVPLCIYGGNLFWMFISLGIWSSCVFFRLWVVPLV